MLWNLPAGPYTLEDVTRLAEADSDHRFELSEGNLIVMAPSPWRHQEISLLMATWLRDTHVGSVNATCGVRTADDNRNGRVPDVVVTNRPVAAETVWLDRTVVALAVEVVSKGSERLDHWLKPIEYAEAGIPLFWRVEPDEVVIQFRLEAGRYVEYGKVPLNALLSGDVPVLN
ncbi:Uma2 family endonuclease [Dactylosporangium sp. NPDC051541]|uniref:Uma2 family endonuclease n=1 Tax=Dactylosporangium sp. NPDC051541 TaxID=3363977 RepID=UPI0037B10CF2